MCGSCCAYKSAAVDKFFKLYFCKCSQELIESELNELLSQLKVAQGATQPLVEVATVLVFLLYTLVNIKA